MHPFRPLDCSGRQSYIRSASVKPQVSNRAGGRRWWWRRRWWRHNTDGNCCRVVFLRRRVAIRASCQRHRCAPCGTWALRNAWVRRHQYHPSSGIHRRESCTLYLDAYATESTTQPATGVSSVSIKAVTGCFSTSGCGRPDSPPGAVE